MTDTRHALRAFVELLDGETEPLHPVSWQVELAAAKAALAASPAPNPDHSHAAAPTGYRCADCQIDGEPCPRCYEAGWRQRHPNVQFAGAASPAPHEPPAEELTKLLHRIVTGNDEQLENLAMTDDEWESAIEDTFGNEEFIEVSLQRDDWIALIRHVRLAALPSPREQL